ncbi:MAG TPA: pilus assembly protein PilM [Gammaproteobacteria bacterium]
MFGKRLRNNGLTAVVTAADGVHAATVVRDRANPPRVVFHDFAAAIGGQLPELKQLLARGDASRYRASTLLDGRDYQLLLVEAPDVRPEELRAAVRWRIKDLINFHIDDAIIDVFEIPDQRHANRNRMMYAVAARASQVSAHAQLLTDAGLDVDIVDLPEMAVRNLAALLPEESRGLALIHLNNDGGIITISRQGTLYLTRRLDTGVRALDAADHAQRERLCEGVLLEVQRSLDYYDSHFPHGPVAALALTPTTAATSLAEYLPQQLETPVLTPRLEELLDFDAAPNTLDGDGILAIGAALRHEERAL